MVEIAALVTAIAMLLVAFAALYVLARLSQLVDLVSHRLEKQLEKEKGE